nr:unnamed protein product [Callosobruchus analis]
MWYSSKNRLPELFTIVPDPRLRHKANSGVRGDVLHFTFGEGITKFHVSNATLFVFLKGTDRRPLPDVNVEVFKVQHPGGETPSFMRVASRKMTQPLGKGSWAEMELTETVSEWFKNPRDNYGFLVNATVNGKKIAVTDVTADKGKKVPFVEISTTESKRRIRRQIAFDCDEKMDQSYCCRYPLMVDFEVIGFDFIIAPKRYNAHMCHGECPFLAMQKHVHTHLTQMTMSNSMPPCCTPRKMSGITMLYFDNQLNVVYGALPGMVVDRCGCM